MTNVLTKAGLSRTVRLVDNGRILRDTTPELLAPAGNWECARAAVANGADAIYFGLDRFNARLRADNFKTADLPELMAFLHENGARGFVTMNTLIFTDEMQDALDYAAELNAAGVDGVIVQDLGFARELSEWKKEDASVRLELHASTQMTLSSGGGLSFVSRVADFQRAVLARELNLDDIGKCAEGSDIPLEVFVHGALCVAYSGQCLTSESLGQRSANRGECAQACRMPYVLMKDGKRVPMGERRYLLSPQDLCSIDLIGRLVGLGVKSYKIEGRLKSPEYVAAVTRAYRKALDAAVAGVSVGERVEDEDRYAMQMVFSRGFSTGWLEGTDHPKLTHGRHGKKRGACLGEVRAVGRGWVDVEMEGGIPCAPGDGFVFDAGMDRNEEQGGRIWKVEGKRLFFHGKGGKIDWDAVHAGQKIWKTDDPALNKRLGKTWSDWPRSKGVAIDLRCTGREGEPLVLESPAYGMTVKSRVTLEKAVNRPLTAEVVEGQLARLGGTGYCLGKCDVELPPDVMLPLSELNAMRRELVAQLKTVRQVPATKRVAAAVRGEEIEKKGGGGSVLSVLCRTPEQVGAVLEQGIETVYLDFEDVRLYRDAIERVRAVSPSASVFLATLRIHKPGEEGFWKQIEGCEPDGVLVRNPGAAEYFRKSELRKVGDFSLNVANPWTARTLMEQGGFERLTVSYDLDARQVRDLLRQSPSEWFELTLHQHMPMFHMEHCVFCTFLSEGRNFKDCGRPCERHSVELQDRVGQRHVLFADAGCRNTVFNGRAQTGAAHYKDFADSGLRYCRVELLRESAEEAGMTVSLYRRLIEGEVTAEQLSKALGAISRLGVTSLPG